MSSSDSDRPPVLAHQRFVDDRKSLADLDLAQRFRRIHDTNMWGAAASTSGLGSEIDATAVLRTELPRLFRKLGVTSLLDAPCGDAGWINKADLGVRLVGVDIVAALIDGEATVKTFQRKNGQLWLLPHNAAYDPIDGTNASILGIVTAVLRKV